MSDDPQSILEAFGLVLGKHPELAPEFEKMASRVQGKGYWTTLAQEVDAVVSQLQPEPGLAVDIGANVGDYSAELRGRYPRLEIHAFEPSATNIGRLNRRFHGDDRVKIAPFAVSETAGTAVLYSNEPGSGLGSLTKRLLDHHRIGFEVTETVNAMRFEDYWNAALQRRTMDIVKIDVEGHELSALRSFGPALEAARVIQFESGGTLIDTRTYFRDFWYLLSGREFALYRITPAGVARITRYLESEESFLYANYVAVNQRERA